VRKVVIDPGHGGLDPGAGGFGLREKDITLDIALVLRGLLADSVDVSMTRDSDKFVSLSDRAKFTNTVGADLFVSIHVNAGGGTGYESYIYTDALDETGRLAGLIHNEVASFYKEKGFPDRGLKKANFTVLRETAMPAVLLENLFIDRKEDAEKLKDPGFRREIAGAVAKGIFKAFDLPAPTTHPDLPPHWANKDFLRLWDAGLVKGKHDLDSPVSWGEFSAVMARLLDQLKLEM
jgi:N-acetylmuramoyl-L-alanine amidase